VKKIAWSKRPLFVGTVTTEKGLKFLKSSVSPADLIEIRVDALLARNVSREKIELVLRQRKCPIILTLRIPAEGGQFLWKPADRMNLFATLLPWTDVIDLELATVSRGKSILRKARKLRKKIILSAHSIQRPVSPTTLKKWCKKFKSAGANYSKVASLIKK
jgi:3-dehydroquinate dehydratase type I